MSGHRRLSVTGPSPVDSKRAFPMTTATDHTAPPADERTVRQDIDQLHAEALDFARRTRELALSLDHGDYCAAGGRVRTAVTHIWRAAEDLHGAFHTAPPRCAGPDASLSRLCRRRMRYLAARIARRAE